MNKHRDKHEDRIAFFTTPRQLIRVLLEMNYEIS